MENVVTLIDQPHLVMDCQCVSQKSRFKKTQLVTNMDRLHSLRIFGFITVYFISVQNDNWIGFFPEIIQVSVVSFVKKSHRTGTDS